MTNHPNRNRKERMPTDPMCQCCKKRMKHKDRLELGFSVMTGKIALCSEECVRLYNCKEC